MFTPTIPPDLLESLVQDTIGSSLLRDYHHKILTERCTPLSDSAIQQLQEYRDNSYGKEVCLVTGGYRVPVRFESFLFEPKPTRVIFYRLFLSDFGSHKGWDVIPEQDVREKLGVGF